MPFTSLNLAMRCEIASGYVKDIYISFDALSKTTP
jgi:hypothetical protein